MADLTRFVHNVGVEFKERHVILLEFKYDRVFVISYVEEISKHVT